MQKQAHSFPSDNLQVKLTCHPLLYHDQTLHISYLHPLNKITEDHWVIGPQQQKLLWLPASLINQFPHTFSLGAIPHQQRHEYDDSKFVHGDTWM
jgi:hypothetical protein